MKQNGKSIWLRNSAADQQKQKQQTVIKLNASLLKRHEEGWSWSVYDND